MSTHTLVFKLADFEDEEMDVTQQTVQRELYQLPEKINRLNMKVPDIPTYEANLERVIGNQMGFV